MATRIVEGKKPYTGGKAITVDENKVISLNLRDENNLIIYDAGDDEIYVDLQLPDGITPLDAFPVGITVGRVLVADDWDVTGTLACFKTTSGDNIKLLYGDNGKVYIDNGTGLFKQIYLKGEVDALIQALRDYVDAQLALKQDQLIAGDYIEIDNNVISAVIPTMSRFLSIWNASSGEPISFPASTPFLYTTGDYYLIEGVGVSDNYRPAPIEYDGSASTIPETDEVANGDVYIYDGAVWLLQSNHGKTVTFQNIAGDPYDNTNLATALNAKQNTLVNQSNIKSINNQSLLGSGDLSIAEVPSGGTNGQVLTKTSQGPAWQNATGGAEIEYKTQVEYNALLPGALTDNKHYFIYTESGGPTPIEYTITGSTTVGSYTPPNFSDLQGFFMSPDGLNAYATFWNGGSGIMAQYSLSTSWDISTASQTQYISLSKPNGFCFSNDGTYMFYSTEDGMKIVRYSLSTPRDISTASQDAGQSITVDSSRFAVNVCISEDGSYIWYAVDTKYTMHQYELTTPFDLTTATNHKTLAVSEGWPGVAVKNDGKYMYMANGTTVKQYELATPYDITSTATEIGSYSNNNGEHRALYVSNDCIYWAVGVGSGITEFEAQPIS